MADHCYRWQGEAFRVVIAGDVIAMPRENWSGEGYGRHISEEWLLSEGNLPKRGGLRRRRILAYMIRRALAAEYAYYTPEAVPWPLSGPAPEVGR